MVACTVNPDFWYKKRVLLTGHTGFKGSWAAIWLNQMGAEVVGLSLAPETTPSLYQMTSSELNQTSHLEDICEREKIAEIVKNFQPEIVLHMAAQALVRKSYRLPLETYETNVIGTLNLLDALVDVETLQAVLVVTSDKVYQNNEKGCPFKESDPLGGDDPYSSSKAACEIATASFAKSFFSQKNIPIATARAGNVIGGGDFSEDRLIPDIWKAAEKGEAVTLRYPNATRPWQHVLESISGYFTYLQALAETPHSNLPKALNFGPANMEVLSVGKIASRMQASFGINTNWDLEETPQPAEKSALALDASLAHDTIGWQAQWNCEQTLEKTAAWYEAYRQTTDMHAFTIKQIQEYSDQT